MDLILPDFNNGMQIMVGGLSISVLITLGIAWFTRYIRPLTENTIQVTKGVLSMIGYFISVFLANAPEYTNLVMMIIISLLILFTSSGVYDLTKDKFPSLVKSSIDNGDKNRGV